MIKRGVIYFCLVLCAYCTSAGLQFKTIGNIAQDTVQWVTHNQLDIDNISIASFKDQDKYYLSVFDGFNEITIYNNNKETPLFTVPINNTGPNGVGEISYYSGISSVGLNEHIVVNNMNDLIYKIDSTGEVIHRVDMNKLNQQSGSYINSIHPVTKSGDIIGVPKYPFHRITDKIGESPSRDFFSIKSMKYIGTGINLSNQLDKYYFGNNSDFYMGALAYQSKKNRYVFSNAMIDDLSVFDDEFNLIEIINSKLAPDRKIQFFDKNNSLRKKKKNTKQERQKLDEYFLTEKNYAGLYYLEKPDMFVRVMFNKPNVEEYKNGTVGIIGAFLHWYDGSLNLINITALDSNYDPRLCFVNDSGFHILNKSISNENELNNILGFDRFNLNIE